MSERVNQKYPPEFADHFRKLANQFGAATARNVVIDQWHKAKSGKGAVPGYPEPPPEGWSGNPDGWSLRELKRLLPKPHEQIEMKL